MPLNYAQPGPRNDEAVQARLHSIAGYAEAGSNALAGTAPAELTLEEPHEVYTVGLDQLSDKLDVGTVPAGGWRYLLHEGGQAVAAAETTLDAQGEPAFAHFNSGPFVASTAEALERAETYAGSEGGQSLEPRLLHVPALHAMALWLHGDDPTGDVVLPLRPVPPTVDPEKRYSMDDYLDALRESAPSVEAVGADDTTGG